MAEDLRELERDVEAARAKLTGDIALLRSPHTFSEFTQSLKQTALETRDNFIDDARSRTRSAIEDMVETIKEKAVANPTAALVIGAGVAWHFIRRPPITAALIGGGLYSLLRTEAPLRPDGGGDPLQRARENLKSQAQEFAATAGEMGRQAADIAKDKMTELAEVAGNKALDLSATARERLDEMTEVAGHKAAELRTTAKERFDEVSEVAGHKAAELSAAARERLNDMSGAAREKARDFSETASDKMKQFRQGASDTLSRAPLVGSRADGNGHASYYGLPNEYPEDAYLEAADRRGSGISTDTILLGAAGLAVAAAIAAMYQRQPSEYED